MTTDLIKKLEGMTKPDREVDWEIQRFFMSDWMDKHGYKREGDHYRTTTPPIHGAEICSGPEHYTSSVDAAIALTESVLPGSQVNVSRFHSGLAEASIGARHVAKPISAATPAIALCIAILKAKEASNDQ